MNFEVYFIKVEKLAKAYGYSTDIIDCFTADIKDCYDRGCTVEECVEEVF